MKLYREIIEKSKPVDAKFKDISESELDSVEIMFNVPSFHPRSKDLSKYVYSPKKLEDFSPDNPFLFIVDESVSKLEFVQDFIKNKGISPIILKSIESEAKTKPFLDELLKKHKLENRENLTLIIVGGGLLLNIGSYLAERISAKLVLFPTTVLSMADSSGGKVRVNFVLKDRAYKHFYKSFYEPNAMFLDDRFLDSLPEKQKKIGLSEIIKHGLFQSKELLDFLFESGKSLYTDKNKMKKAILWAADLKKICIDVDVEENENGSRRILRGGHDFSDRLEEDLKLKIPHGIAVVIGIIKQLEQEKNEELLNKAKEIFELLELPYTLEQFEKF